MSTRTLAALVLAALPWTPACGSDCVSEGAGPNVVVLVIDTLRADRLPFYGHDVDTAPFLTTLAERGVVFERAWSTSSWTAPSTASLFTSVYPMQHGVTQGIQLVQSLQKRNSSLVLNRIPGRLDTLPEILRAQGYRTFGIADNPNICAEEGFQDGFCRFQNFKDEKASKVNEQLAEWKDEIRSGGKWFVYLHYMDPHFTYTERAPWFVAPGGEKPAESAPRQEWKPWVDAAYDSEIRYADEHVRQAFELLGVDDSTVVVFVADHGEELLQRSDIYQHDFKLYSELTRIPFIVVHPGAVLARKRVKQNASLVDVLPTLRDILGMPRAAQEVGESLVPYYTEATERANDRPVFSMRSQLPEQGGGEMIAVVQGDEKLILTSFPPSARLTRIVERDDPSGAVDVSEGHEIFELFDLSSDWYELENRAEHEAERVAELRRLWEEFAATAPLYDRESESMDMSEEDAAKMSELGYVESDSDE